MNELIYQKDPEFCTFSKFKDKEWTNTIKGYIYEANKMVSCALLNEELSKRKSKWKVSINVEADLPVPAIKDLWTKATRNLVKQGIVALWIREPSLSNHCNYNLIVSGTISREDLAAAIEEAMPDRSEINWHKWIRPIRTAQQLHFCLRYFLKAEPKGLNVPDSIKHEIRNKRLLFKPKLGLRKYGQIGKFWVKPKKELWEDIKDTESQLGAAPYEAKKLAHDVAKALLMNPKEVARNLCFYAESPVIKDWVDQWKALQVSRHDEPQYSLLG